MKLTVVFRDESPMVVANDPPTHRTVSFLLTDEQVQMLAARPTGYSDMVERIAYYILEDVAVSEV